MAHDREESQSQELIKALIDEGMTAREFVSKDGKKYVVVPLLDTRTSQVIVATENPELVSYVRNAAKQWPHQAYLFICSGSPKAPFEVGVIGYNGQTGEDYSPDEWSTAHTVQEAVQLFQNMWETRDNWLNDFVGDLS